MKNLDSNIKFILEDKKLQKIAFDLGVDLYARINSLKDLYAEKQQITSSYDIGDIEISLKLKK